MQPLLVDILTNALSALVGLAGGFMLFRKSEKWKNTAERYKEIIEALSTCVAFCNLQHDISDDAVGPLGGQREIERYEEAAAAVRRFAEAGSFRISGPAAMALHKCRLDLYDREYRTGSVGDYWDESYEAYAKALEVVSREADGGGSLKDRFETWMIAKAEEPGR